MSIPYYFIAQSLTCSRRSLDKLRNFKKRSQFITDRKYNQLALAFWTCLQLER